MSHIQMSYKNRYLVIYRTIARHAQKSWQYTKILHIGNETFVERLKRKL